MMSISLSGRHDENAETEIRPTRSDLAERLANASPICNATSFFFFLLGGR